MPYVDPDRRAELPRLEYAGNVCMTSGELNYMLTMVAIGYLERHGLRYETINDIIGALEGAKLEFTRRVAFPYEDKKIALNGDVYPHKLEGV